MPGWVPVPKQFVDLMAGTEESVNLWSFRDADDEADELLVIRLQQEVACRNSYNLYLYYQVDGLALLCST